MSCRMLPTRQSTAVQPPARQWPAVVRPLALLLALAVPAAHGAQASDWTRTPLPGDHPLVGTWRIELPQVRCHELYVLRADGTGTVTSGDERSESEFRIATDPDGQGFFQWDDRIVTDNGKPDCMGNVTPQGDETVTWIHLLPSGKEFVMCFEQNLRRCIGPFVRQEPI